MIQTGTTSGQPQFFVMSTFAGLLVWDTLPVCMEDAKGEAQSQATLFAAHHQLLEAY